VRPRRKDWKGQIAARQAWMRGSALPGFMMGTSRNPGEKIMGALFANAPVPG